MKTTRIASVVAVAFLSLLVAFLYSRASVLYCFYANAPSRLERINNLKNFNIKFADVVRNCEDAYLNEEQGFILLSCDPGRDTWNTVLGTFQHSKSPAGTGLYLWNYSDRSDASQPEKLKILDFGGSAEDFHPLGIDYHAASNTLFVVNHAGSGSSIEMFKLFPSECAASHIRTVSHPHLAAPNAITAIDGERFFATNDHRFSRRKNPWLAIMETYSGLRGGSIVHVDLSAIHAGLEPPVNVVARVPLANGIALLNSSALAVASSNTNFVQVYGMERNGEHEVATLTLAKTIPVSFHPDNLSVDSKGKLLVAGHPHLPTLDEVAKASARCSVLEAGKEESCKMHGLSWISEWSDDGGVRNIYVGGEYGTSSTAVRDVSRNFGFAVGLYERGVLVWDE